ncbi:MAG: DUF115 domain-containing protein [Verrucomicrobia bacterium]|nr:DUF115 domain-containing protein [Verrucomicrobiota bacterium]
MATGLPSLDFHLALTPYTPADLPKSNPQLLEDFLKSTTARAVYLFGLPDHLEITLDWLKADPTRLLIVLEDDLGVIGAMQDQIAQFHSHPQIHFRYISGALDDELEECARDFPVDRIDLYSLPHKKKPKNLLLKLLRKTVLWHATFTESLQSHLLAKNTWESLRQWPKSCLVNNWGGLFEKIPVIICGAGPSLAPAIPQLKKIQNEALIIAGGSAIRALHHFGVQPHLAIAIDPNDREYDCVKGSVPYTTPFLYGSRLSSRVFELFQGPLGYIKTGTGGPLEAYFEDQAGITVPSIGPDMGRESLSVTTLAVSLAYFLGCDPITLVGVDLAYSASRHYAHQKASIDLEKLKAEKHVTDQLLWRKGKNGTRAATLTKWIMEAKTLSSYAKKHKDRRFIDASEEGLPLPGFERGSIELRGHYDIAKRLEKAFKGSKLPQVSSEELLQSLKRSSAFCGKLARGEGHSALHETELEEELAYKLLLAPIHRSLNHCFRHVSGEEKKWEYLREAAQAFLPL